MKLIEKLLNYYYLPLQIYIDKTLLLTQSIVLKINEEALVYNSVIRDFYPNITIDETDKSTWKYYKNLAGEYYYKNIVDQPVMIQSLDNFETIELTKDNLNVHTVTKEKLLKFDSYYLSIVEKYPLQEIYIRSVITNVNKTPLELSKLNDYTIVSYNSQLIEEQENYLIPELQKRIDNYKVTWLLNYYCLSDSLYLSAQICELYNFMFKNILSLRLEKSKTGFTHSFFLMNFLASHYYLEEAFYYLNRKQLMFLYKNLHYLQNHVGNNFVFKEIIDYLFTDRNISLVTYKYKMLDTINNDNYINYYFKQKLLNSKNLPYSKNEFTLDDIEYKEKNLAQYNEKEYLYKKSDIDFKLRNSLFNDLYTKDLESIFVDVSDNVRYKLVETIVNNFIYLAYNNKLSYIINFTLPFNNEIRFFTTKDLVKLYLVCIYYANNERITEFKEVLLTRLYKETLPTYNEVKEYLYRDKYYYEQYYENIVNYKPNYSNFVSSYQFESYITNLYKFDLGLWLFLSNLSDKDDKGQFENINRFITKMQIVEFNDETVDEFLNRTNLSIIKDLDSNYLFKLTEDIIDVMFNNKLKMMFSSYYMQKVIVKIFKLLKSYTTQLINEYYSKDYLLAGLKDVRCAVSEDVHSVSYFCDCIELNIDFYSKFKYKDINIPIAVDTFHSYSYRQKEFINISKNFINSSKHLNEAQVPIGFNILEITSNNNQPTQEHLQFLISN